ncbi:hypothetical protein RhiLY_08575 [Ceratobasidium sp. AG-Ba]|nr:hypothetical protein RhiLY_08575 [Ceratobasidium sp. AG-Ba]
MTTILGTDAIFSNGSHKDRGQKSPPGLLRPSPPLFKDVTHVDLASDIEAINEWLSEDEPAPYLQLHNITLENLKALEKNLDSAGRRIRHDWDRKSGIVSFRMPCAIHETGGTWLSGLAAHVTTLLREPARCGRPLVVYGASSTVKTEEERREPDGQYQIRFGFENQEELSIRPPRVILETSYTQDNEEAIRKIENYLVAPNSEIHAGIHVGMSNKITLTEDFQASIAVYVKKRSGHLVGQDYLVEEALRHIEHQPSELSPALASLKGEMEDLSDPPSSDEDSADAKLSLPRSTASGESGERDKAGRPNVVPKSPSESSVTAYSGDTTLVQADPFTFLQSEKWDIECRGDRIMRLAQRQQRPNYPPDPNRVRLPPALPYAPYRVSGRARAAVIAGLASGGHEEQVVHEEKRNPHC